MLSDKHRRHLGNILVLIAVISLCTTVQFCAKPAAFQPFSSAHFTCGQMPSGLMVAKEQQLYPLRQPPHHCPRKQKSQWCPQTDTGSTPARAAFAHSALMRRQFSTQPALPGCFSYSMRISHGNSPHSPQKRRSLTTFSRGSGSPPGSRRQLHPSGRIARWWASRSGNTRSAA